MKETILITGAGPNGVTGKLFREILSKDYHTLTPSSHELDLTDDRAVESFFGGHKIDYVVHCATFQPLHNTTRHLVDDMLESNLRMYFSLASQSGKFKRMIYLGSGAEYDKSGDIKNASEEEFGRSIPKDQYGLGKYIMNQHCRKSENIYNLRIFGTINPFERATKNVVSNMCAKAVCGEPISLRRDCLFSFIDMEDTASIIAEALTCKMSRHDYNITDGTPHTISEIAHIIATLAGGVPVTFQEPGQNKEYTGCNREMAGTFQHKPSDIRDSIGKVYNFFLQNRKAINLEEIDNRWK